MHLVKHCGILEEQLAILGLFNCHYPDLSDMDNLNYGMVEPTFLQTKRDKVLLGYLHYAIQGDED